MSSIPRPRVTPAASASRDEQDAKVLALIPDDAHTALTEQDSASGGGASMLRRLAAAPVADGGRWLVITAQLDKAAPGRRAVTTQPGEWTLAVEDVGHVRLLMNQQVLSGSDDVAQAHEPAVA